MAQPTASWQAADAPTQPGPQRFNERQYALFLHLSALGGLLIGFFFVGPLVMWLIKKDESAFVDAHGRAAVDFHLSLLIYGAAGALLFGLIAIVTLGIGAILLIPALIVGALALLVCSVVFPIIAGVKASDGRPYRYPLSLRMLQRSAPQAWVPQ